MSFGTSNTRNWTGGKLHVRIQVTQGMFTGGAQMYVKTGSAYVFGGTYINFPAGSGWKELTMDLTDPMTRGMSGTYDPAEVITLGVQLNTGMAGTNAGPVTFLIDSFSIDLPAGGSGGSGVAAAAVAAAAAARAPAARAAAARVARAALAARARAAAPSTPAPAAERRPAQDAATPPSSNPTRRHRSALIRSG